jgi:hypothetical protein
VQAFIKASLQETPSETFDALALAIARFQAAHTPAIARLAAARGASLEDAGDASAIPAVPCDVFRLARIAAHAPAEDTRVFRTSGTSQGRAARGEHPFRTTSTYVLASLEWGRRMLWPDRERLRVIVLAPPPEEARDSSLGFMLERFAEVLGAEPRSGSPGAVTFALRGGELDASLVARACEGARASGEAAIVLGASFAFVHLLEAASELDLTLPKGSRAMQTGGFKGRSRAIEPAELRRLIASALAIPEAHVVGEYGMTELSSQAYEGTLAAALGALPAAWIADARPGVYFAPPWMRIEPVDPVALTPVAPGEAGIARVVDLANVDSAVAVQTSDLVRAAGAGIELLGRAQGAPPRGCSIAIDEMLGSERR